MVFIKKFDINLLDIVSITHLSDNYLKALFTSSTYLAK